MNSRKKDPTQAEIADLMRPALERLPLTKEWQDVVVTIKRNDDESLALHSIVMQPAFEPALPPAQTIIQLPPIPPGYCLQMVGDIVSIEPIEPEPEFSGTKALDS